MLQHFHSSSTFKTLWKCVRLLCRPIQTTKNIWRYTFRDVTPPLTPWGGKTTKMEKQLKINTPSAVISEKLMHSCYSKSLIFSCCFWKGKKIATGFCGRKNLWSQSHVGLVAGSKRAADWKVSKEFANWPEVVSALRCACYFRNSIMNFCFWFQTFAVF